MARKIKFRAWDGKEMFPVNKYDFFMHIAYDVGARPREHKELMQYTGLKDKNGVEIYEGDIVRAYIDYGPGGVLACIYAVWIGPHGCGLQEWTFSEGGAYLPEVIGNIYQNPELLEQNQ